MLPVLRENWSPLGAVTMEGCMRETQPHGREEIRKNPPNPTLFLPSDFLPAPLTDQTQLKASRPRSPKMQTENREQCRQRIWIRTKRNNRESYPPPSLIILHNARKAAGPQPFWHQGPEDNFSTDQGWGGLWSGMVQAVMWARGRGR